jgi:ABC-type polysaccharide/polyol phosphate transport system ATPase subunit
LFALKDVGFTVKRGETVGIIGRNGAGKSTLLKILAGVTAPSAGRVEIRGRLFPMIELNAGLNPELSGRENIRLLGAIMGLTRREIERKLPEIEEFTELGEWFDRPVRMYSSGMLGRLGFGVAVNIESDIILIDETFAVGDLKFQNKSLARIKQMQSGDVTVLLVSHGLDTLQFVCKKGIFLENGRILAQGSTLEAINAYESRVFKNSEETQEHRVRNRITSEEINIYGARLFDGNFETLDKVISGKPFGIEIDLRLNRPLQIPMFSIGLHNENGVLTKWNISMEDGLRKTGDCDRYLVRAWYPENHFVDGSYEVHFAARDGASFETLERIAGLIRFDVTGGTISEGIISGACLWKIILGDSDAHINGKCNPSCQ